MCRAYTLTKSAEAIGRAFSLAKAADFKPSYNLRPTRLVPVIIQGEELGISIFYWGATPAFAKNKTLAEKLYNTRCEILGESVVHRKALRQQRCLVPADGFYTWKKVSKKGQVPYYYSLNDSKLFAFAGLWQEFEEMDGKRTHTFSIITTAANDLLRQTSTRMPVIFETAAGLHWLETDEGEAMNMLKPFSEKNMAGFAVSGRVNHPETDGPELIAPAPPADQFGNYTLFD